MLVKEVYINSPCFSTFEVPYPLSNLEISLLAASRFLVLLAQELQERENLFTPAK